LRRAAAEASFCRALCKNPPDMGHCGLRKSPKLGLSNVALMHSRVAVTGERLGGLPKERDDMTKHKASLFRLYDNRCANCGDDKATKQVGLVHWAQGRGVGESGRLEQLRA